MDTNERESGGIRSLNGDVSPCAFPFASIGVHSRFIFFAATEDESTKHTKGHEKGRVSRRVRWRFRLFGLFRGCSLWKRKKGNHEKDETDENRKAANVAAA